MWSQLDDLDFADDLALLSHNHQQMQDKTTRLMDISAKVGLSINKQKTEIMKVNTASTEPVLLEGSPLYEVESFAYLGSIINVQGGTDEVVKTRIGKGQDNLPTTSNNLEVQRIVATYQDQDFQLKCKVNFTLWCRDMEDNKSYRRQSTNLP